MEAQGERLAVLANNLANVTTGGFKADHLEFFQSLSSPRAVGPVSPTGPAAPLLAPPAAQTRTDFSPGNLRQTGNPLDVAIDGPGFFVVRGSGGAQRLTRAGSFTLSPDGTLSAPDGAAVLGSSRQPITLPDRGAIEIDTTGRVLVDGAEVGQLLVVDPPRDQLTKDGGTRFAAPPEVPLTPAPNGRVAQGFVEGSNVNAVLTMIEMIDALRVYESAQRAARSQDETLSRAVNDVGRA
jgi:flagellar basal body rod protein FlgG